MPEESISTPGPNDDALRRLEHRIESLEYAAQQENRWWRGGLIAALVLVALSILIAGHHRHRHHMMMGWQGRQMMPYGPPPPPYPDYGYYGGPQGWHHRQWDGPGPGFEAQPQPPKG